MRNFGAYRRKFRTKEVIIVLFFNERPWWDSSPQASEGSSSGMLEMVVGKQSIEKKSEERKINIR